MGNVYIEPRPDGCGCDACRFHGMRPTLLVVSQAAVQAAVELLGIKGDVVVHPQPLSPNMCGAFEGPDEHGRWVVAINDRYLTDQYGPDYTVWHELGHVLDTERNLARYPGLTWDDLDAHAQHQMAQVSLIGELRGSKAGFAAYQAMPEERFANAIAKAYQHIPLVDLNP